MKLIIKNGTIVTPYSMYRADLEAENGVITACGERLDTSGEDTEVVDARGLYVLPGAVDIHTHMSDPFGGAVSSDSCLTGTRAAACGGVTTLFDFATQTVGHGILESVDEKKAAYKGNACIDYAFHCIITDLNGDALLDEFETAAEAGITSFKCYTVYEEEGLKLDDESLLKTMEKARDVGGITCVHAESSSMLSFHVSRFLREGRTSPWYHYLSRPEAVEAEADKRVVLMARSLNAPLYLVHMADREGLEEAVKAKLDGFPVYIETCPHYLEFNSQVYLREDAVTFVCSPPIKGEESRAALWRAVKNGGIDTIATDHCPFTLEEKNWGVKDFTKIPNGCGGVESRYAYMLSAAHDGKISYPRAVELCAANPARIFGCTQKGSLDIGKDADIVLYDPRKEVVLRNQDMHTACDHTIWEGVVCHGYPVRTYLKGKLICDRGNYIGNPGDGCFVKRIRNT